MTEMRWKDGYSAEDAAYESPEIVRQWYSEGHNVTWTSEDVKLLFSKCRNGTSNEEESRSSSPPAGTIAGAVIGGVFGVALLIGLAFFFAKRKKPYTATPQHPPNDTQATDSMYQKYGSQSTAYGEQNTLEQHQLHGQSSPLELDGSSGPVEVHGRSIPVELPAENENHEAKSRRQDLR
ncbi:unnamed protein product [Colletotrichum noveboracense]|uniref:Uncharacterized protein n=1 Tax=Colletotrichum noveboracense TaxID=2664923 RepID=A0A9W4WLJ5_9PEZI|nr:unnamed protein product [Colletotrichum noveboracense]